MYEEFPTNESLLEYIREDKSHEVVTLQRLKNKAQEGKREVEWRKEAKTKNYWKTRCSRHTFTILAISWAYEVRFCWFKRPRNRERKIYNFHVYHFLSNESNRSVGARNRSVRSKCLIQPIGWMKYRTVGWIWPPQVIFNAQLRCH